MAMGGLSREGRLELVKSMKDHRKLTVGSVRGGRTSSRAERRGYGVAKALSRLGSWWSARVSIPAPWD